VGEAVTAHVLSINCGSSSLKLAIMRVDDAREEPIVRGEVERVGGDDARVRLMRDGAVVHERSESIGDHARALNVAFEALASIGAPPVDAVGHRLVHGGADHALPVRIDEALRRGLERLVPFAPVHLPAELRAIDAARVRFGDRKQVACFDTGFHRTMPDVAQRFALPRHFAEQGVRRYGFHGLSYESVVRSLGAATLGRAVIAHLGSGASMVAVRDGKSVDTTMGFTPASGLVMGTRVGDVDPGLVVFLIRQGYDARALDRLFTKEAGLLALSETTADMRELLQRRGDDPRAALAVDVFCWHARRWIGALTTAIGGLDTLVFTGGIGERAAPIRAQIARGLEHLGVRIDPERNEAAAPIVSPDGAACTVRIVQADEERMIARHTYAA
jgi:acetate kinase